MALLQAGLEVWDAEREILPGDNWAKKIAEGLEESDAMVVLLTPDGVRSQAVRREIDYASGEKSFDKRLIPVLVGSPEKFPEDSIPWILKRLKYDKSTGTWTGRGRYSADHASPQRSSLIPSPQDSSMLP